MMRLFSLLLVIGALLLLAVSTALGADTAGTSIPIEVTVRGAGADDSTGKSTSQRLVDDAKIIETDVRLPALPAERVLIER